MVGQISAAVGRRRQRLGRQHRRGGRRLPRLRGVGPQGPEPAGLVSPALQFLPVPRLPRQEGVPVAVDGARPERSSGRITKRSGLATAPSHTTWDG